MALYKISETVESTEVKDKRDRDSKMIEEAEVTRKNLELLNERFEEAFRTNIKLGDV